MAVALSIVVLRTEIAERIQSAASSSGIDLTVDPDDIRIAAALTHDMPVYSSFGTALALEMLTGDAIDVAPIPAGYPTAAWLVESWRTSALDAYRAIYGEDYQGCEPHAWVETHFARGTQPGTVVDCPRARR